jgi:hypothetical protein
VVHVGERSAAAAEAHLRRRSSRSARAPRRRRRVRSRRSPTIRGQVGQDGLPRSAPGVTVRPCRLHHGQHLSSRRVVREVNDNVAHIGLDRAARSPGTLSDHFVCSLRNFSNLNCCHGATVALERISAHGLPPSSGEADAWRGDLHRRAVAARAADAWPTARAQTHLGRVSDDRCPSRVDVGVEPFGVLVGCGLRRRLPRPRILSCGLLGRGMRSATFWSLMASISAMVIGAKRSASTRVVRPLISAGTVDSHCKGGTDLAHSGVTQTPQPADEDRDRDAFDRVEVHRRTTRHGVVTGFEHDFADEPSNRRRTWSHERAEMARDHCVARQDDDRSTTDLGHLAPPDLPTRGKGAHEAAAARRNDAKSPHSSCSSSGCSS